MKEDTKKLKPIYITGLYRSGTTLASRILNNHPDLSITYDSVHFMRFSYGQYDPISKKENYFQLIKEIQERIENRWKMHLDMDAVMNELKDFKDIGYAEVYNAVMRILLLEGRQDLRWGEKTNVCWGRIPDFLKMFPQGKAIHLIRDPRDVVSSYKYMTTEPGLRYLDAIFASLHSSYSVQEYQRCLSANNYYCLKYERLIESPQEEAERLCDFLEIEFDSVMLNDKKFEDKNGKVWGGGSAFDSKMNGISAKPVGRWRNKISNMEVFFTEMVLGEQMRIFGYELGARPLNKKEQNELQEILKDPFIEKRYQHWLKTGEGIEAYPSDPIQWAKKEMQSQLAKT